MDMLATWTPRSKSLQHTDALGAILASLRTKLLLGNSLCGVIEKSGFGKSDLLINLLVNVTRVRAGLTRFWAK
jgi:hypothetical protein